MTAPDLIALVAPVIPGNWRETVEPTPHIAKESDFLSLNPMIIITNGTGFIYAALRIDGSPYYFGADFGAPLTPSGSHLRDVLVRVLHGTMETL